jgi:hypothetical protein
MKHLVIFTIVTLPLLIGGSSSSPRIPPPEKTITKSNPKNAEDAAAEVQRIKKEYSAAEAKRKNGSLIRDSKNVAQNEPGPTTRKTTYRDDRGRLRILETSVEWESGWENNLYYFYESGELFFAFLRRTDCDGCPCWVEDPICLRGRTDTQERLYFHKKDHSLIRWRKRMNKSDRDDILPYNESAFSQKQSEVAKTLSEFDLE